ncbi:hypothetical protein [uncultured Bacteroides sp.]|nr:hypothetical protein [uncultured Bacteroides sp.]
MMLHRSLAMMGNNSYAEAEKSANLFGSIFKLDVKPEDMMHHSDEEINNSLADYDKMCHYLDSLERLGIDQEDVIAFCKHVEYNSEMGLAWYQAQCNLHYKYYAEAVLSYLLDLCTYDEMAEQFFEYSLFTQKKSPAKVRRFIKDLKRVLDLFYEISAKRMRRKISGMLEYRR